MSFMTHNNSLAKPRLQQPGLWRPKRAPSSLATMPGRKLTAAEIEAAKRLAAAIGRQGKTHEEIAAEVGVNASMISQWATARRAVSARRAAVLAKAIGLDDPGEISPAWAAAGTAAGHFPFDVDMAQWEKLSVDQQQRIKEVVRDLILLAHEGAPSKQEELVGRIVSDEDRPTAKRPSKREVGK